MSRAIFLLLVVVGALTFVLGTVFGLGAWQAAKLHAATMPRQSAPANPAQAPLVAAGADSGATPIGVAQVAAADVGPTIVTLFARDAVVQGDTLKIEGDQEKIAEHWTNRHDVLEWNPTIVKEGLYQVEVEYACDGNDGGGTYLLRTDISRTTGAALPTGGWDRYMMTDIGPAFFAAGKTSISIEPSYLPEDHSLMNLRAVRLRLIREMPVQEFMERRPRRRLALPR